MAHSVSCSPSSCRLLLGSGVSIAGPQHLWGWLQVTLQIRGRGALVPQARWCRICM